MTFTQIADKYILSTPKSKKFIIKNTSNIYLLCGEEQIILQKPYINF